MPDWFLGLGAMSISCNTMLIAKLEPRMLPCREYNAEGLARGAGQKRSAAPRHPSPMAFIIK